MIALCLTALVVAQDASEQAEREARFEEMMSGAKLVGSFTVEGTSGMDLGEGPLHEETYWIHDVTKTGDGDEWVFTAGMEFGGESFEIELALDVKWAGDTPVITLTDKEVAMVGTYSARVLFHDGRYAGTWSGKGYGGVMFGKLVREGEEEEHGCDDEGMGVNWPSFRGPQASGVAEGFATVAEWNVEEGKNVLWRTPIPGLAHSSPAIWGDRIYLTTAVKEGDPAELKVGLYGSVTPVDDDTPRKFQVLCVDKKTGGILWTKTAFEGVPACKRHPKGSHAASSPATDGERVLAFFGAEGLHCYDKDGELLWSKDFGKLISAFYMMPGAEWGFSSSPVIHGDRVVVQCDVMKDSFVAVLNLADGEEIWRMPRKDLPTWSTPTVDVREGRSQILVNGFRHMGGYDLATGKELWKLSGAGDIPVPTPVVAHDMVYLMSAHGPSAPIYAVHLDAEGELSKEFDEEEQIAWGKKRRGNYMQTPLVYGDYLYCCSDAGVLRCYDARTGEEKYSERLGGGRSGFTSSGVAADGKLYFTSEEGEVHVLKAGPECEVLAVNDLTETHMASPAISEGVLYFRTRSHLVAIGTK